MIDLYFYNNTTFVWNPNDVHNLRKNHRIIGSLIGLHPYKPHQSRIQHLPLRLTIQETKLLIEKGICRLLNGSYQKPDNDILEEYSKKLEEVCNEQIVLRQENCTKNSKEAMDSKQIKEISKDDVFIQIFTECPWKKHEQIELPLQLFSSVEDQLKYAVFKDLWERSFFITNGSKFGGDFLAYAGDPFQYHSLYIVVCLPPSKRIQAQDIVFYGRLGHQVKKMMVFSSFNEHKEIEYLSIEYVPEKEESRPPKKKKKKVCSQT